MNYRSPSVHYNSDSSSESSLVDNFESDHTSLTLTMNNEASAPINLHGESHLDRDQQSRRSSISTGNSYFSVRHSLNLLPIFNGKNIPVHQFTSDCRGVLELVEPEERLFFFRAILQTKLTGDAALVRSVYTITNLEELCEALIKEFGNYLTFEHWELEINNLRQNRDESIEKYVTKVRKLNSDMIIAISNYPDQAARAGLRVFATNKLIDHFLGGLHRSVGQHLLAQKFNTLEDAIEGTIRFIKKSQYHAERFRVNNFNKPGYVTCNYCKKIGHSESECRKKTFYTQNKNTGQNFQYNNHHNGRDSVQNFDSSKNKFNDNTQANRYQANNGQNYNYRYNSNNSSNNYRQNNSQPNLNYQGQAKSAQRQGQSSSRANPIHLIEPASEHTQSEQVLEMSFPSPSTNLEIQQTDSC
mgnify:CR=1 FL=1